MCIINHLCEKAFNVHNLIKMLVRNMFGSIHVEALLRNALEGADDNFGNHVFEKTSPLCKNNTKYRFPYAKPSRYMSFASDTSCSIISATFPNFDNVDCINRLV